MPLNEEQEQIKAEFVAQRGFWGPPWDTVLELDPTFVRASLNLHMVPWRKSHLTPKFKALCNVSVHAAATFLHGPAIGPHIRTAFELGATPQEVMEVLELAATLGIHAMNIGVPLLVEVLEERGRTGPTALDEHQEELKERFTQTRGYWHDFWNEMLELDPEMFEAYTDFSAVPWQTGPLSPAEKELIYISYDIAATHLYVPGTKLHIRNALDHGATPEQVLEVMEISSMLGIHAVTVAAPILAAELAARSASAGAATD